MRKEGEPGEVYDYHYDHYVKTVCEKCSDEQKKKRDCDILHGATHRSCQHMENAIHKHMKDQKEEWVRKMIEDD